MRTVSAISTSLFAGIVHKAEIQIHLSFYAVYDSLIGILPHVKVVIKVRHITVLRQPEFIVLQLHQVKLLVSKDLIKI